MRFLVLLFIAVTAQAQVRYHFGDDPRWAAPDFDDSAWPAMQKDMLPPPSKYTDGVVWVRVYLPIPENTTGLALRRGNKVFNPYSPAFSEEFWVDGQKLGSDGKLPPQPENPIGEIAPVFDLPSSGKGPTVVVARRIWIPPLRRLQGPVRIPEVEIGLRGSVRLATLEGRLRALRRDSLMIAFATFQMLFGIALLIAWRLVRGTQEVFWFALYLTFWNAADLWQRIAIVVLPKITTRAFESVLFPLLAVFVISLWSLTWEVFAVRNRWLFRLLAGFHVGVGGWLDYAAGATVPSPLVSEWIDPVRGMYLLAAAPVVLILAMRSPRRGFEANLIAAGIVLFRLSAALSILNWIPANLNVGEFVLSTQALFQSVLLTAMTWVLIRGLWRTWLERQGLSAEFEAAREMQEALVQRVPETPGLAVEFAYLPASQVGGDFYRIFPADDGATLVVVGDVSGKGLKAAMTVSVLAGAMEAIETRQPGPFLTKLNAAATAHMQSGFATCCAMLIRPDGKSVIANAGHPSPYCDGRELETEPGLPLGIAAGAEYPESITRGDQFTFVSDGVVEAANPKGELFGFDRTLEISGNSAHDIAQAAKAWGQNDDITVVTVRRSS